ncbi:flagellar assembly protein FliH [Bacillus marinisedimentorum]|uniref:flagellar assembly protein FliH n=1 Tax=Bacillus marinisedimentorum TaxID=1821260 RepID=UPI0007DF7945|nr:flagellar assembly protein FliH [Bacillus marinisedimentorum]
MSNILKSGNTRFQSANEKIIAIKPFFSKKPEQDNTQYGEEPRQTIVEDAGKQAADILEKARRQAAQILERAEKEAEAGIAAVSDERARWEQEKEILAEEAREYGKQQGLDEGREAAEHEYRKRLDQASGIVSEAKSRSQKRLEESEFQLLSLGLKAAEKIVKAELEANQALFRNIVSEVIKEARDYGEIVIYLHPDQYVHVSHEIDGLKESLQKDIQFSLYPDESLEPLSCILESSFGRIDASVDSQLTEIGRKLSEMMESGQNDEH